MLHLACEDDTQAALEGQTGDIRDRWIAACAAVGLPPPTFLFFGPWNHHMGGALNAAAVEANNAAMLAVAQRNTDCCFFSLYAATNGVLLDGSATGQDWVSARGYATFRYGSTTGDLSNGQLLDGSSLHPADQDAAAFMGHLFAEELRVYSVSCIIVVPPRRKLRYPSGMPV